MAEHAPTGPAELGAPMDYPQHQRTYAGFVSLIQISILANVAILQSLALFGLAANGFWLGVLMLLLIAAATIIAFATKGSVKALVGVVIIGFLFMALALG